MKNNKAQSAVEFIMILSFIIFSLTILSVIINEKISNNVRERDNQLLKITVLSIQDEISLASKASDGYLRSFRIPLDINGKDYKINITDGMIYARTLDGKNAIAIPVINITGDVKKGDNAIKKQGGLVYLNR